MKIIRKYLSYYEKNGFIEVLKKIILKPSRLINKKIAYKKLDRTKKEIFFHKSLKEKFSYIYSSRYWPSKESVSGPGSEIENTKNIREEILKLIDKYEIKKFLDIPCGDFNWIKNIVNKNFEYTGGDIVPNLINTNKEKFTQSNIKFIEINLIEDKLPYADLMLCRDCLIHFSNNNIKKFFNNFIKSEINYILITSYELNFEKKILEYNYDINDGDFRPTFLMEKPFNLPQPLIKILDKDIEHKNKPKLKCYLYLYSKNQLKSLIENKNYYK